MEETGPVQLSKAMPGAHEKQRLQKSEGGNLVHEPGEKLVPKKWPNFSDVIAIYMFLGLGIRLVALPTM